MWRTPVDTGEEMAELCRTDGHDTVPVLPLAKHVIGELSASRRDPAQLRVIVMCPENTPAVAARAPGGPGTGAGTVGEERYPDGRAASGCGQVRLAQCAPPMKLQGLPMSDFWPRLQ
jgi:hypothetical protein